MSGNLYYLTLTYLIKLNDIRVSNDLEDVDLPGDPLDVRLVLDLVLLEDLDGDLLARYQMRAQAHFAERALSEGTACKGKEYMGKHLCCQYNMDE